MKQQTTLSTDNLESVTKTETECTGGDIVQLFTEESNHCHKQIKRTTDNVTYNTEVVQLYTERNYNVRFCW